MRTHALRAAAVAAAVAIAAPVLADGPDAETVIARVGETEIKLGHMVLLYERLPPQMRQRPDADLFDDMLQQLIEQAAVAEAVDDLSRQEEMFLDLSRREFLTNTRLTAVAEAALTDEAVEAAYAERFLSGEPQLEYNAAHILVQTQDEALELRAELEEGADFAELAVAHSRDPGSGAMGGDLGWFGTGRMVPTFEAAVVALEPGEISDPVETQFGWHLILLNGVRDAEAPPLDAVRNEIARDVQLQAIIAAIAEAQAGLTVERLDEGIDRALMRDQTLFDR